MFFNTDDGTLTLGVRELCELALNGGDLDAPSVYPCASSLLGHDAIERIWREAGATYRTQLPLFYYAELDGMAYSVSGILDGAYRQDGKLCANVIKCVRHTDFAAPPREIFLAELRTYALLLAANEGLSDVGGRLTYVSADGKRTRHFQYHFSFDELRSSYMALLERISHRAAFTRDRALRVLPSAASAVFPYTELREGQEIMIRECYGALSAGQRLFAEAPTGTGKTISALYGAVRALGKGHVDKIFYLTAKSSTSREAYTAASKLYEAGARLRTVVITAKERACACSARAAGCTPHCRGDECELARGYHDRAEHALFALLNKRSGFTEAAIRETALQYRVCPYELSLDLSELCDVVICDYNYAFDPQVFLRRYFAPDAPPARYAFLIDEAHNLPDRVRDMHSALLHRSALERLYARVGPADSALNAPLEAAILAMRALRRLCRDTLTKDEGGAEHGFYLAHEIPPSLLKQLTQLRHKLGEWAKKNRYHPLFGEVDALLADLRRFLLISEFFDEGFLFYMELDGNDTVFKCYCLDPSRVADTALCRAFGAVMFSATLTPTDYFCDLLGGRSDAARISLPSPFDPDRTCVAVAGYLSTRYEDRDKSVKRYAAVIAATVSPRHGNYIAYFPSYDVLQKVWRAFHDRYPDVDTVVQKSGMTSKDKEQFLGHFKNDVGHLRVGFCVLGGLFSEGVDLPGSRLIGCIVFGTGLPGLSNERNIIRDYYALRSDNGYDYAYTFPGMNNVLQAAGRVIRRDDDRGVIVLVDDRYTAEPYTSLLPAHWPAPQYAESASSLAEIMKNFWRKANIFE